MNSPENSFATANNNISLFFSKSFSRLTGDFSPVHLNLNAPHNFTFTSDSLKEDVEKVRWGDCKKTINTKMRCVSNFNGAMTDGELVAFDERNDLRLPLQLIKLSCEFNVKFELEITDDGICFDLLHVDLDIASLVIVANVAIRSNAVAIKLLKHETFLEGAFNATDKMKIHDRFLSRIYTDCLEKELFSATITHLQEKLVKHKKEIGHNVTENNIKLIVGFMSHELSMGGGMWAGRSIQLLLIAYEMIKQIRISNKGHLISIPEFLKFLELDNLHHVMIAEGGNNPDCSKSVSDLKAYLLAIPDFDNEPDRKHLGQSQKTYEQHGYLVMDIRRAMDSIPFYKDWVDFLSQADTL